MFTMTRGDLISYNLGGIRVHAGKLDVDDRA